MRIEHDGKALTYSAADMAFVARREVPYPSRLLTWFDQQVAARRRAAQCPLLRAVLVLQIEAAARAYTAQIIANADVPGLFS